MLKLACQREPVRGQALAAQPTLSRFENSVNRRQLLAMGSTLAKTVIAEQAQRRSAKKPRWIVIDMDPTCDPTYGAQQLTLFNGHYDTYCYLPLVMTISFGWEARKYPVAVVLRPGTAGAMVRTGAGASRQRGPRDNARYLIHNLDYRYGPYGAFDFYYGHSDMENAIKDLKNDLAMDRASCSQFTANLSACNAQAGQLRLLLTPAAYVLLQCVGRTNLRSGPAQGPDGHPARAPAEDRGTRALFGAADHAGVHQTPPLGGRLAVHGPCSGRGARWLSPAPRRTGVPITPKNRPSRAPFTLFF